MEEFARPAHEGDLAVIVALEAEAREVLAGTERGGRRWLAEHPALRREGWQIRLADPGWATVVAGLDGEILGVAGMRLPVGRRERIASIEAIYVTTDARELGLGEFLLRLLLDLARQGGAEEIDATALPGDRETKNLFERFGMTARLIVVSKQLD